MRAGPGLDYPILWRFERPGAPLQVVAEDLKRTAGIDVTIAPGAEGQSFRGALIVDKDRARTIADLAALSGTTAERRGDGWVLTR